jgi:hypothetical protein
VPTGGKKKQIYVYIYKEMNADGYDLDGIPFMLQYL